MLDRKTSQKQPDLSVVIPVGERVDDLVELYRDYKRGLDACGVDYEIVVVLDGPHPGVSEALLAVGEESERLRIVQLAKRFGEATALMTGFANARAAKLLTLPAYHQIQSDGIASLLAASKEADMVVARRWPRRGSGLDRLRREGFHGLLKLITGERFHDLGCGARVLNRQVVEEIAIYGEQHRLLPVLASRQGFTVREIDVAQSERDAFKGRYRLREYLHRLLDVLTVFFLIRFTKKPLRFFGMLGSATFALGAVVVAVLVAQRLLFDQPLADRPALLIACLFVVLGVQLFALGLLGELIIFTHARELREYRVANIVEAGVKDQARQRTRAEEGDAALSDAATS
ncbi:MAG TPA: glycosyltransferase [Gammaproteobacteria bacterium]